MQAFVAPANEVGLGFVRSRRFELRTVFADYQRVHGRLSHFAADLELKSIFEQGLNHLPGLRRGEYTLAL
jgi:hypothetical protein